MKVLLINSTNNSLQAVKKALEKSNYKLNAAEGYSNALESMKSTNSQLALVNWGREDYDLEDLCRRIKRLGKNKYIYIMIIAGREKEKELQKIIDAGADDFIFRPFSGDELFMRINRAKRIFLLEEKNRKSKKHLMKLAKEDPITNLLNRRAILDEALNEMGRAAREKNFISAIIINIQNIQTIIEDHGSIEGSDILVDISSRLKFSCRPYDKIGRYDLSDFIIILPDSGVKNAKKLSERILEALTKKPFVINNKNVYLHVSIGVAEMDPDDVIMAQEKHSDDLLMNDLLLDSLIKRSFKGLNKALQKGVNKIEAASD